MKTFLSHYAIADGLSALTGEARSVAARPPFAGGGRVGVRTPPGSGVLASLCPCVMTEGRKGTRTQEPKDVTRFDGTRLRSTAIEANHSKLVTSHSKT